LRKAKIKSILKNFCELEVASALEAHPEFTARQTQKITDKFYNWLHEQIKMRAEENKRYERKWKKTERLPFSERLERQWALREERLSSFTRTIADKELKRIIKATKRRIKKRKLAKAR
jgi:hypothetical protein